MTFLQISILLAGVVLAAVVLAVLATALRGFFARMADIARHEASDGQGDGHALNVRRLSPVVCGTKESNATPGIGDQQGR